MGEEGEGSAARLALREEGRPVAVAARACCVRSCLDATASSEPNAICVRARVCVHDHLCAQPDCELRTASAMPVGPAGRGAV